MPKRESKTKYLELPAVFEWAKVFPENMDKTGPDGAYESHGGAYTIDAIITKDVFQQLKDAGSQANASVLVDDKWQTLNKLGRKDYEDAFNSSDKVKVKFKRKHDAPYTYGGAPQVGHADGSPWDLDADGLIGNGSRGILYVSVYEVKGRAGTRLDGVQVLDLVEYVSDYDEDEAPSGGGFRIPDRTGSTPKKTKTEKPKETKTDIEEDIIPF